MEIADPWRKKSRDCQRLYAYCLYQKYENQPDKTNDLRNIFDDLLREHDDPIARHFRAIIYLRDGDKKNYARNLQSSADSDYDYIIARHIYGSYLFTGEFPEINRDISKGFEYLMNAAKSGYPPALQFVKQTVSQRPDLYASLSPVLKCRLFDHESKLYEKFDSFQKRVWEFRIQSL